jgi:Tol biopolymer transport system component
MKRFHSHRSMFRQSLLGAVAVLVGFFAISSVVALATFPGKNGRIAFDNQAGDIFTMNPDGSDIRQLTSFAAGGNGAYLASWSPDGRHIAFQLFPLKGGAAHIWIMDGDGANQRLLLDDPQFSDAQPSFSPDGKRVVFTHCDQNCAIYTVGVDGKDLEAVTQFDSNPDIFDYDPAYSPDGKTIAFSNRTRGGVIAAIYRVNVDGSNVRLVTNPAVEGWSSDWAPDGEKLCFISQANFGPLDEDMMVVSPDGTGSKTLTDNNRNWNGYSTGPHAIRCSWSPQGEDIVFEQDAPDYSTGGIYILKADGSRHVLVSAALNGTRLRVSHANARDSKLKHNHKKIQLVEPGGFYPSWGPAPQ